MTLDQWLEAQRINGGPHGFEAVGREALSRMWAAASERPTMQDARWYCLSRDGLATLCAHAEDAAAEADRLDRMCPNKAPHRAVQLVDVAQMNAQAKSAALAERHECAMTVWMTLMEAESDGADDLGLDGWMREAEAHIKARQ
jgi:hypothetical protein